MTKQVKLNKIQQFIKDNNLSLDGYGSDMNSVCCAIAGYSLYITDDDYDWSKLIASITENGVYELTTSFTDELYKVYEYAYNNDYWSWWDTVEAQNTYKF